MMLPGRHHTDGQASEFGNTASRSDVQRKPDNTEREKAMKNFTKLVAVATFATCIITTAQAGTGSDRRSELVQFADLDMTRAAGAAALYQRLRSAARRVCREQEPGRHLDLKKRQTICMNTAIGNAVTAVNRPALTAHAAARGVIPADAPVKIAGK